MNGKLITLGNYRTQEEASAAYQRAAREYYGEFATQILLEEELRTMGRRAA